MASTVSFLRAVEAATKLKGLPVFGPKLRVLERIETRKITVEQFQALRGIAKPAPSQRQHEWRWLKGKAKYLLNFALPQGVVTIGVLNGEYYIVDGNTRGFGWEKNTSMPKPDGVLVVFYDIESLEEMRSVYDAVDSTGSKKTIRNEVVSILRELHVNVEEELHSDLVLSGALKGVIKALMRSGTKTALRIGLTDYLSQILLLDKLDLGEKSVKHSAVLAAALTLLKTGVPFELVKKYVTEFVRLESGDKADAMKCTITIELKADEAFLMMRKKTRSTSSEGAVDAMLPVYLTEFRSRFCREVVSSKLPAKLVRMAATQLKAA